MPDLITYEVVVVTEYTVTVNARDEEHAEKLAVQAVSAGDYDDSNTEVQSVEEVTW